MSRKETPTSSTNANTKTSEAENDILKSNRQTPASRAKDTSLRNTSAASNKTGTRPAFTPVPSRAALTPVNRLNGSRPATNAGRSPANYDIPPSPVEETSVSSPAVGAGQSPPQQPANTPANEGETSASPGEEEDTTPHPAAAEARSSPEPVEQSSDPASNSPGAGETGESSDTPGAGDSDTARTDTDQDRDRRPADSADEIVESTIPKYRRRIPSSKSDSASVVVKSLAPKSSVRPGSSYSDGGEIVESNTTRPRSRSPKVEVDDKDKDVIIESNVPKFTSKRRPISGIDSELSALQKSLQKSPRAPDSDDGPKTGSRSPLSDWLRSHNGGPVDSDYSLPYFEILRNREAHIAPTDLPPLEAAQSEVEDEPEPEQEPEEGEQEPDAEIEDPSALDNSLAYNHHVTAPFTVSVDDSSRKLALTFTHSPRPGSAPTTEAEQRTARGAPVSQLLYGTNLVSFPLGAGLTGGLFLLDPNQSADYVKTKARDRSDESSSHWTTEQPIAYHRAEKLHHQAAQTSIKHHSQPTHRSVQVQATPLLQRLPTPPKYQPLSPLPFLGGGKKPVPITPRQPDMDLCTCGFKGHHPHTHFHSPIKDPDTTKDEEPEQFKPYPSLQAITQPTPPGAGVSKPWYQFNNNNNDNFTQQQQQQQHKRKLTSTLTNPIDSILDAAIFKPRGSLLDQLSGIPAEKQSEASKPSSLSQYHQHLIQQQQQQPPSQLQYNISLKSAEKVRRPRTFDVPTRDDFYEHQQYSSAAHNDYYRGREESVYDNRTQRNRGRPSSPHNPFVYPNNSFFPNTNAYPSNPYPNGTNYNHNNNNNNNQYPNSNTRRDGYDRRTSRDIDTQTPLVREQQQYQQQQTRGRVTTRRDVGKLETIPDRENRPPPRRNSSNRPARKSSGFQSNTFQPRKAHSSGGQQRARYYSDQDQDQDQEEEPEQEPERRPPRKAPSSIISSYRLPPPSQQRRGRPSARPQLQPLPRKPPSTIASEQPEEEEEYLSDGDMAELNGEQYDEDGRHMVVNRRGRLVTFYRNGDRYFSGLATAVNKRMFNVFETLLVWLTDKIPTPSGVKHIFSVPDGGEVTDLDDFEAGRTYAVSSTRNYVRLPYGNIDLAWYNTRPSAGRYRRGEGHKLFHVKKQGQGRSQSYPSSRANSQTRVTGRGRLLTIISNSHRDSQQKVMLNPDTVQTFDEMLSDVGSMIKLQHPPVTALYMAQPPYRKMESFSHLMKAAKYSDTFIACGREGVIRELQINPDKGKPRRKTVRPPSPSQQSESEQPLEDGA